MFALFCVPWAVNAQQTVEIGTDQGTTTNNYLPGYTLYDNTLSEQIYTAEEVGMAGSITSISFYNGGSEKSPVVTLYMVNTDQEAFSSTSEWLTVTSGDLVFEGSVTFTAGAWTTITLDTPFEYDGTSNLGLVAHIHMNSYSSGLACRVFTSTSNCSMYKYRDNTVFDPTNPNVTGTRLSVKNQIMLDITPNSGPTCEKPETLGVEDLSPRAASLTWTGGSGLYNVEVNGQTYASELEDMRINLENLTPATNYTVKVQSVCRDILDPETEEPKVSGWKSVSFTTPCEAISTYPWTENFDSYTGTTSGSTNNLPQCYHYINGTTYSYYSGYPVVYNSSSNSNSGNNHLYFYSYYSSSYTYTPIYAVLPEMEGLNGMMLTLYAKAYNANSSFTVGMMTDPTDATTFEPIETKTPSTTEYEKFTFILGEGHYVAIMMEPAASGTTSRGIRIDDIMIDEVPTCLEPTDLVHTGSTTHTAELSWTNGSEDQTAWQICLNGNENNLIMANSNPFTIENLDASSTYTAKVRAYCSETDQSYWSNEISFSTECEAISTLPWNENFDAYTAETTSTTTPTVYPDVTLPVCWQFLNCSETSSSYPQAFITSVTAYAVSGNCLFFKSSSTTPLYAVLPEFAENIANLMLTFTYRNESVNTSNGTLIVGYMTNPADTTTFTSVLSCNQTTTLTEMEVLFADAPAGSYIAFKYQGGSTNNYYLAIDDVMVGLIPSCMKPSALMLETPSSRTAHTATLKWTNGTEDQDAWQIAYSTDANFDPNEVNAVDVTTNPATISGLAASTTYYAYVRANCGNDGFSAWCKNKTSFTTLVGNAVPTGLTYDPASLTSREVTVSWTGVATNDLHESFDLYYSTENTMPEELDEHSLIAGITESTYHFEDLTPETQYYVWVRDNCGNDGYSNWSSSINFTMASDCQIPDGLAVEERTNTSVVISWNGYGQNEFNLKYSTDGENWETIENVANPYTLTGLTGNTTYQVEVQPICNPDEWSDAMSCITACDAVTEFPWNEDFEGFTASSSGVKLNDNCWVNEHIEGTGTYFFEVYSSTTATGGNSTKMLRLHDMYAGTMTKLVLPEMNIPTGVNHQFILDVYRNVSGTSYPEEGIRVFASTDGEIEGATEMAFISRNCTVSDNNLIPSEETTGWYTYELPIPITGTCFIILRGESKFGSATYMDNFIVREIPSCLKPTAPTAANITSNTAELSWTANSNEQAWTVYYKKTTEEEYRSESADSNPFVLENLDAASNYECYVVANCSADDASEPSVMFTFTTECEVFRAIGYTENFDSYTVASSYTAPSARVLPLCWNAINTTTYSTYTAFPTIYYYSSTNYANSTPNSLKLYSYYNSYSNYDPQPQYAILPEMEGLAGTQVKLMARGYNATSTFKIGTMSNPTDASTFTMIAEQTLTTAYPDEPFEYIVPANCTDSYLAIMIEAANSSRTYNGVYIDDIAIVEAPSCFKPTDLAAVATPHSATLSWTANSEETEWTIYYKEVTNEPADYIEVSGVTENPYLLDNVLDAAIQYEFYVVANCSADDASEPSAVYEFTTPCEAITITDETPYTEDFEAPVVTTTYSQVGVMPGCWDNYPVNVNATAKLLGSTASYNYAEEGQVLYFYGRGDNYALLPVFTNDLNTLQINFKWATESSTNGTLSLGYITDEDEDYNTFTEIKAFAASDESYRALKADTVGLSSLPANATRLIFKWNCSGQYGCNVDDVEVSLVPGCEKILVDIDNPTWSENFEDDAAGVTNPYTEILPECWQVVEEYTSNDEDVTPPQVYYNPSFNATENGAYSLRMRYRSMLAMPELDENVDFEHLQMSLYVRQSFWSYKLEIGVVTDIDNPDESYHLVATVNNPDKNVDYFECNFSSVKELVGGGRYIVFKNVGGSNGDLYSNNYLDDITLTYVDNEDVNCQITESYTEDFESYAVGTEPDCWEVITAYAPFESTTRPQVYSGYNTTVDGSNSLRLKNRCIYAMPAFGDYAISNFTMTFNLRQPKSIYRLQVGLVDAEGNFNLVKTFKCSTTTDLEPMSVSFNNLDFGYSEDMRVAFRNTLVPGTGMSTEYLDYSVNYIDDINFSYEAKGKVDENFNAIDLEDIAVYPNPTTGNLYIDAVGIQKVECYNQMGQLVRVYDNVSNSIDLNNLSEGVYMLRITVPQGVTVRKVVKR